MPADSLDAFFRPKSVAIAGASPIPTKVGNVVFHNFLVNRERGLFKGEVYPVNPKYDRVLGQRCYPSLKALDKPIETLVVAIPAEAVPSLIREAGEGGVRAAIMITAGFGEIGNLKLEQEVRGLAHEAQIRIIGPNCLGVYDPYSGVDTLFLPEFKVLSTGREVLATPRPLPGSIALISQSGALGSAALDYMAGHGMGVRSFVSLGNRMDVGESELLDYFAQDAKTKVILLYIEGLVNGRQFLEAARRTTRIKPVVVLKAGTTEAGARAAASHTAALAGVDRIYEAAFEQTGISRIRNLEEFFDLGRAFSLQKPAHSNFVAILTNAGGAGIIAADAAEAAGLRVDRLPDSVLNKLEVLKASGQLLPVMSGANPIDLSALATSQMYRRALGILLKEPQIGAIIAIVLHQTPSIVDDVVNEIAELARSSGKPIVACDIGGTEMAEELRAAFEKRGIPSYSMPERAARAVYGLVHYGEYLRQPPTEDRLTEPLAGRRPLLAVADLIRGKEALLEHEAAAVCRAYGIPVAESQLAKDVNEARRIAKAFGFPLVMKIVSRDIIHKSDVGGVIVNVQNPAEVEAAYGSILGNVARHRPEARIDGVLVQKMAPVSTEVIVGLVRDPTFGPVIMFGLGGVLTEVLKDISFRVPPISRHDAERMVAEIKGYPILTGIRGRKPVDIGAVADILLKVSHLALEQDRVEELDLNPVFVYEQGAIAADVRLILRSR